MAEKDRTAKNLEAYNNVFADIVNGFLFDGRKVISEDDLIPAENESFFKADGNIRSQERDISKFWMNTNIKIALIGYENQSDIDKLMAMRVIGYDGANYKKQYIEAKNSKDKDRKCYPVVTLVIYFGKKEWKYEKNLHSCLDIPDDLLPFVNDYKMNFYSFNDMSSEQIEKVSSDFKIIAQFFNALNTGSDYHPTDQKMEHPEEVLDMIDVFSKDHRFRDEYNTINNRNKEGGISMCEIYDKILMEGEAKGRAEGKAEGRAEGKAEGKAEGMIEGMLITLVDLFKKGIITLQQAAEQAGMSIPEFQKCAGLYVSF